MIPVLAAEEMLTGAHVISHVSFMLNVARLSVAVRVHKAGKAKLFIHLACSAGRNILRFRVRPNVAYGAAYIHISGSGCATRKCWS